MRAILLLVVMSGVWGGTAWAGPRYDRNYANVQADGVLAESRFGHGTVSGPVREGRFGYEVRLPGGTWEACKRSCSETLRISTVDFWEAQQNYGIGAECGIFGCLELRYPR